MDTVADVPAFAEAIPQRRPMVVRDLAWRTFAIVAGLVVPVFGEDGVVGLMLLDDNAASAG